MRIRLKALHRREVLAYVDDGIRVRGELTSNRRRWTCSACAPAPSVHCDHVAIVEKLITGGVETV